MRVSSLRPTQCSILSRIVKRCVRGCQVLSAVVILSFGCEDSSDPKSLNDQGIDPTSSSDVSLDVDLDLELDSSLGVDRSPPREPALPPCDEGAQVYCELAPSLSAARSPEELARCARPQRVCEAGRWSECQQPIERCDDVDNDCDGLIDEAFEVGEACAVGVGECLRRGVRVCTPDGISVCSQAAAEPIEERCDGLDNDCDGRSDERFPRIGQTCELGRGACLAVGVLICDALGAHAVCDALTSEPTEELCDGVDNDCDGRTDEALIESGASCDPSSPLESPESPEAPALLGPCAEGIKRCVEGAWICEAQHEPSAERCDEVDNDCDGRTDEAGPPIGSACKTQLRGSCRLGAWSCGLSGEWRCVSLTNPSVERCDAEDNDCDGEIDESDPSVGRACETASPGSCSAGRAVCDRGELLCEPLSEPAEERCDGEDNDCDGSVDEALNFDRAECDTRQRGVCRVGEPACVEGELLCLPSLESSPERCDDLDNDCDGLIDETFPSLGGECAVGQGACLRVGVMGCDLDLGVAACLARPLEPEPERCDEIDNDCDGVIDNLTIIPSSIEHCGECGLACARDESLHRRAACYGSACDLGPCQEGYSDANLDPADGCEARCEREGLEVCDLEDNDCDGLVDEAPRCRFGEPFDLCVVRRARGDQDALCDTFHERGDWVEWWSTPRSDLAFPTTLELSERDEIALNIGDHSGESSGELRGGLQRRIQPGEAAFEMTLGIRAPRPITLNSSSLERDLEPPPYLSPESRANAQLAIALESRPFDGQLIEDEEAIGPLDESDLSEAERAELTAKRRLLTLWIEWVEGEATISIKQSDRARAEELTLWRARAPQLDVHEVTPGEQLPLRWLRDTSGRHRVQVDGVTLSTEHPDETPDETPSEITTEVNQASAYHRALIWINLETRDANDDVDDDPPQLSPRASSPSLGHLSLRYDRDLDGVYPPLDNCALEANPDQADGDGNGLGTACDDPDSDGAEGSLDNCPLIYNPGQADLDADGVGDLCAGEGELLLMADLDGVSRPWRYRVGYGYVAPVEAPPTSLQDIAVGPRGSVAYLQGSELILKTFTGDEVSFGEGYSALRFIGVTLYSVSADGSTLKRHEVREELEGVLPAVSTTYEAPPGFALAFADGLDSEALDERVFIWEYGQELGDGDAGVWLLELNRAGDIAFSIGPIFDDPNAVRPTLSVHPSLPQAILASEEGPLTGVWSISLIDAQLTQRSPVPTRAALWWDLGGSLITLRSGDEALTLEESALEPDYGSAELFGRGASRAPEERSRRGVLSLHPDLERFDEARLTLIESGDRTQLQGLRQTGSRVVRLDEDGDLLVDALDFCPGQARRGDLRYTRYPWVPLDAISAKVHGFVDGWAVDWLTEGRRRYLARVNRAGDQLTSLDYTIQTTRMYNTPESEGYHMWLKWGGEDYWAFYVDGRNQFTDPYLSWISSDWGPQPEHRVSPDLSELQLRASSTGATQLHWDGEVMRLFLHDYQYINLWSFESDGRLRSHANRRTGPRHPDAYYDELGQRWRTVSHYFGGGRSLSLARSIEESGFMRDSSFVGPQDSKTATPYYNGGQIMRGSGRELNAYITDQEEVALYLIRASGVPSPEPIFTLPDFEEVYRLYAASGAERHGLLIYGRDLSGEGLFAITFDHRGGGRSTLTRLSALGATIQQKPTITALDERWLVSWFEEERGLLSAIGALECSR